MSDGKDYAFSFLDTERKETKPRESGVTEIRGPYYDVIGRRRLLDVLETAGDHVDSFKFAGGSFTLMPREKLVEIIEICHDFDVLVSTGGFVEYVLTQGEEAVRRYIDECKEVGFDIVELSAGFVTLSTDDWVRLVEAVKEAGLKPKPEVGIQIGAGGDTPAELLEAEGQLDVQRVVDQAGRLLEAGAYMIMVESEGITENVESWRTDVPHRFAEALGLENVMFEAAEPEVFSWYVQNYGPEVNLFVDNSQILQLEALRRGIWGTSPLWGRVVRF